MAFVRGFLPFSIFRPARGCSLGRAFFVTVDAALPIRAEHAPSNGRSDC